MRKYLLEVTLLVSLILVLVGCSGSTKVDLMSFADVEFSGLDTQGRSNLIIDWNEFENAVLAEDEEWDSLDAMQKMMELESSIQYSVNLTDGLSNGDKVLITAKWDDKVAEKYNLKFSGSEKEITVSGLSVATEIDLFREVYVEYDGASPSATASVRNASLDAFLKTVSYTVDPGSEISNGDTVTVTATYSEAIAEDYGYIVTNTEKAYVVEGIDEYISSYDAISVDVLDKMKAQAEDVIESAIANESSYPSYLYPNEYHWISVDSINVLDIKLTNAYFFVLKKGIIMEYGDVNNSIFLVYQVRFTTDDTSEGEEDIVYLPVYFKDIILRDDGTIDVNITDAYISPAKGNSFDNMYRDVVTANKAKYEYEEISY